MKSILQNHYEPNFASEEARSEIHCQALAYTSSLTWMAVEINILVNILCHNKAMSLDHIIQQAC